MDDLYGAAFRWRTFKIGSIVLLNWWRFILRDANGPRALSVPSYGRLKNKAKPPKWSYAPNFVTSSGV